MAAFAPVPFATPVVSPNTATMFRRTPYISPGEYNQAPTAVSTNNLVPGGSASEQLAELAGVISRASDWVDTICFHKGDGTLAASPSTESGWITPREDGRLGLICNFKPILEVDAVAIGMGPSSSMESLGSDAAQALTIDEPIIWVPCYRQSYRRSSNGKVYVVWVYVNGFPHVTLAAAVEEGATELTVAASTPGGTQAYGIYAGTQLTIHDGANTEVVVVREVSGLTLKLLGALTFNHAPPAAPDSIRVSAVPWVIEQACISLTSALIKMRGTRAMVMPGVGGSGPLKQAASQSGGSKDVDTATALLEPFVVPYMRST